MIGTISRPDREAGDAGRERRRLDEARETVLPISGLRKVTAKTPKATVGMPARISRIGLTILRTRGFAYSLR